jgi:hypothetical protein
VKHGAASFDHLGTNIQYIDHRDYGWAFTWSTELVWCMVTPTHIFVYRWPHRHSRMKNTNHPTPQL